MVELDTSFIRKLGNADKIYRVKIGKNVGNADKLDVIKQLLHALVVQGKQNRTVQDFTTKIIRDKYGLNLSCGNKPYLDIIQSVQHYIQHDMNYVHDIANVETFQTAKRTIERNGGDCDCLSVLCASMLGSVGFPTGVLLVDARGDGMLSHALAVTKLPMPKPVELKNPFTGKDMVWNGTDFMALECTKITPVGWFPPKSTIKIIIPG